MLPDCIRNWWTGGSYTVSSWVFIRLLATLYLIAFLSFWRQAHGLIGSRGILPLSAFLGDVKASMPGFRSFRRYPTLFWINSSDWALHCACALGVLCSLLLLAGIAPRLSLAILWVCYLSLVVAAQCFLSFQWDYLLLETGFLAIFLAPPGWYPEAGASASASQIIRLLLWWLLFRLMFESGVVKLSFRDATWRNLSALDYHCYTQPLPTFIGWYFHRAPAWFRKASVAGVFVMEIALPFLIFGPRECRTLACAGFVSLMLIILLTGNYAFFNFVTMTLALLLLDDGVWKQVLPPEFMPSPVTAPAFEAHWIHIVLAVFVLVISVPQLARACFPNAWLPKTLGWLVLQAEPLSVVNGYGLFRRMTTRRPEIIIQGSMDGVEWREYSFRYKPGDIRKRPGFVAPYSPRLDWQMWFAALGNYNRLFWFQNLLARLLEGSPDVMKLLAGNPFPQQPPRYVQAVLYEYFFTTPAERRATGAWWRREQLGAYSPALYKLDGQDPP